jgi:hypothetical protein
MPKSDRKPDPDFEPNYDLPDAEFEEASSVEYEEIADAEYEEPADPDYEEGTQLTDEAEVADPDYDEVMVVADVSEKLAEPELVVLVPSVAGFAFELGRAVLPITQARSHPVIWRGHLKERHPTTGLLQRVPVYRLDDGYWDCYREEELQAA